MKDFFQNLLHTSSERVKNPFISSFTIAWVIINWKPILIIIFSTLTIEERVEFVSLNYLRLNNYFIIPLLVAVFYTLILPYIMLGFQRILKNANRYKIVNYYDEEILRVEKKSEVALREVELERIRAKTADLSDLNEQIENLKSHVDQLKTSSREKDEMINVLQRDFEKSKIEFDMLNHKYRNELDKNFPDGGSDAEFRFFIEEEGKVELLSLLGSAFDNGIKEVSFSKNKNDNKYINYFIDWDLAEITKNSKPEAVILKLTNKGKDFWFKLKKLNNFYGGKKIKMGNS